MMYFDGEGDQMNPAPQEPAMPASEEGEGEAEAAPAEETPAM